MAKDLDNLVNKKLEDFPRFVTVRQLAIVLGYVQPCDSVRYSKMNEDYLTDELRQRLRMPKKTKIIDYIRLKRLCIEFELQPSDFEILL